LLDVDGVQDQGLAIGAHGEGAVYVGYGLGNATGGATPVYTVLNAKGLTSMPPPKRHDDFGFALAVGELDGDPEQELVVGAPDHPLGEQMGVGAIFIFGLNERFSDPLRILPPTDEPIQFGTSVALGDFDGDGWTDVAVGAPKACTEECETGSVLVYPGPDLAVAQPWLLPNPQPVQDGNFGAHVVAVESGTGPADLFVSGIGNHGGDGTPEAGQVYRFPAPVEASIYEVFEDPTPDGEDPPRFGMHLAAKEELLSVGAPRKDVGGVPDSGQGFVYDGPGHQRVTLLVQPQPVTREKLGFRTALADLIGTEAPDVILSSMSPPHLPDSRPYCLYIWSPEDFGAAARELRVLEDSGDHFSQGISAGQVVPGGREELIMGDPSWDREGHGAFDDAGRVVIYQL